MFNDYSEAARGTVPKWPYQAAGDRRIEAGGGCQRPPHFNHRGRQGRGFSMVAESDDWIRSDSGGGLPMPVAMHLIEFHVHRAAVSAIKSGILRSRASSAPGEKGETYSGSLPVCFSIARSSLYLTDAARISLRNDSISSGVSITMPPGESGGGVDGRGDSLASRPAHGGCGAFVTGSGSDGGFMVAVPRPCHRLLGWRVLAPGGMVFVSDQQGGPLQHRRIGNAEVCLRDVPAIGLDFLR